MSDSTEKNIGGVCVIFFNKNQRRLFDSVFAIKEKSSEVYLMLADKKNYIVKGIGADDFRKELTEETDKAIELLFALNNPLELNGAGLPPTKTENWEINELDKTITYNAG